MANRKERNLLNPEMEQKTINLFREYINFTQSLLKQGLVFEKKVKKFSKSAAAIYLPKRLIGRKYRIYLMPIGVDDPYELNEEPESGIKPEVKIEQPEIPKVTKLINPIN